MIGDYIRAYSCGFAGLALAVLIAQFVDPTMSDNAGALFGGSFTLVGLVIGMIWVSRRPL